MVQGNFESGEVYRYDGQMPVETIETAGSATTVERHALGARGTDLVERATTSGTQTRFPLYDAHGNSVGTLGRSGTNSWSLANEQGYDAWGRVRQGNLTGPLSARYCASLGHVQDDESGLVYMRARYYEPETGRFVSEDLAMDGSNWFAYGDNDPINKVDQTGKSAEIIAAVFALISALHMFWSPTSPEMKMLIESTSAMAAGAMLLTSAAAKYPEQKRNAIILGILGFATAELGLVVFFCQVNLLMLLYMEAGVEGDGTNYTMEHLVEEFNKGSAVPLSGF